MISMTERNGKKHITNLQLIKFTGMYQLLDPNISKSYNYNGFKIGCIIAFSYLMIIYVMCIISIYFSSNDFTEATRYISLAVASSFGLVKIYSIIQSSEILWKFVDFTAIDIFSYNGHNKTIINNAQVLFISVSNLFIFAWVTIITIWIMLPIIIKDNYIIVKFKNNTYRQYRYNMMNLIIPVSTEFYNYNFEWFYWLETITLILYGYVMMFYDCLVMSMGISIAYQLKTISSSFRKLGHENIETYVKQREKKLFINQSYYLKNLILIIQDYQKVIKKMHQVYYVIRPIILYELAVESTLITLQSFLTVVNMNNGQSLLSAESFKLMASTVTNITHLLSTCYLFTFIDTFKNSINIALYDCNWIEMNLEFKKLLLLTMQMNDAEKLKLKGSAQIVVNLALFGNVIIHTFKIVSFLISKYK